MQNPIPLSQGVLRGHETTMPDCGDNAAPDEEGARFEDTGAGRASATERVLSIANVAKMFAVSQLALRAYELRGLIARRHSLDGVRVYGWADCERLAFIIKCRKAGVRLSDIITIIRATDYDASLLQSEIGQETCAAQLAWLEQRRRTIDEALAELRHVSALFKPKLAGDSNP